jgi:hypothetical protein
VTPRILDALQQPATDMNVRMELLDVMADLLQRHAVLMVNLHTQVCFFVQLTTFVDVVID